VPKHEYKIQTTRQAEK